MIKIVIIEDDEPTRKVIGQILKGAGYEPCEAENGLKGLELIATVRPSLVLCDVEMPGTHRPSDDQSSQGESRNGCPSFHLSFSQERKTRCDTRVSSEGG